MIFENPLFVSYFNILENLNIPIIQKLLETFNTNIINTLDTFYKLKIYSEVFENKDKNTLTKLIYNHYNKKNKQPGVTEQPITDYIGGPYTITNMYSREYNINIYLFGEFHSDTIDCLDKKYEFIQDYLQKLLDNTDVFLDMYFEFPAFTGYKYEKELPIKKQFTLIKLFKQFYSCIETITRTAEKCKLGRVHYVDVRRILSEENLENDISWLQNLISYNKKSTMKNAFLENKVRIKKIFNKILEHKFYLQDFFIEELLNHKYIKKEKQKSYIGDLIFDYIKKEIKNILFNEEQNILNIVDKIDYDLFTLNKFEYNDINILYDTLLNINALVMDFYTLCRIFKTFNVQNKFDQPEKPHNIIYYAGAAHTEKIENFLLSIGFKTKEKVNKNIANDEYLNTLEYKNCVNIKNVKQPLFSTYLE